MVEQGYAAVTYRAVAAKAALTTEFLALGNHRKSIRAEIAESAEQVRRIQLDTLNQAWEQAGLGDSDLPPPALLFLMTGIPKLIRLEKGVGISTAHSEVVDAFERYLDAVESPGAAPPRKSSPGRRTLLGG